LLVTAPEICGYNRRAQAESPERFPYPYYPEPGGLLPWGVDENGNDYFWLTKGEPSQWVVVQDEYRGNGIEVHDCSMTEFLVGILERRIEPLASDYPNEDVYTFEPADLRQHRFRR
jgi:hypothetical protein